MEKKTRFSKRTKILSVILVCTLIAGTTAVALTSVKNNTPVETAHSDSLAQRLNNQLKTSYELMLSAKKDSDSVCSVAENALNELDSIKKEFENSENDVKGVLDTIDSDELYSRQKKYTENFESNFLKAEKILEDISESKGDIEENLCDYQALIAEETDNSVPDKETEFNPETCVSNDYETYDVSDMKGEIDLSLSLDALLKASEDTDLTGDVSIDDEIKAKADELKTPLAVYKYVKNNIKYEPYYGARKGAQGTYYALAGNDTDTASLLIGMLRYLGYSAKYANGTVRMTAEQAIGLTATDNIKSAAKTLANLCKDVKTYSSNGKIEYVEMNRTWVEVYVPYTDYRGAGNASGESKWIPLDASFKTLELKEEEHSKEESDVFKENLYNTDEARDKAMQMLSELPEYDTVSELYDKRIPDVYTVYYTEIVQDNIDYLPLSLSYKVISEKTSSKVTNLVESDTVSISVDYGLSYTVRSADVYNKSLTLSYIPASDYDKQLIDKYGDIRKVPAYLLTLVPAITVDDVVVAKATEWYDEVTSGQKQTVELTVKSSGCVMSDVDTVYAGSVYSFVLHYGILSDKEYDTSYNRAKQNNCYATTMNTYSSEILGSFLNFAGQYYYLMTDVAEAYYAYYTNVNVTRLLGLSILGYSLNNETTFGYNSQLTPGSFFIDVEFNTNAVVDRFAENNNSKMFNAVAGFQDSQCEARVWEHLLQIKSVSTTEILSKAASDGTEIHYLSSVNSDEISEVDIEGTAKNQVLNYINSGFIIIIPEKEVQINDWSGTGYVAYNLDTGSSVYKISGGLNGGSGSTEVDLTQASYGASLVPREWLDNYVYASIELVCIFHNFYSAYNGFQLAKSIAKTEGCVIYALDLANVVFSINSDTMLFYGTLDAVIDYFGDDDEAAGRKIVEGALSYLQMFYTDFLSTTIYDQVCEESGFGSLGSFLNNVFGSFTPSQTAQAACGLAFALDALSAYTAIKYPLK
ncbi:MAG: transglutaminase domain-containing protein [Ruminococcus sp.]